MSIEVAWPVKVFSYEESPFEMVGESRAGQPITLRLHQSWGGTDPDQIVILIALQVLAKNEPAMEIGLTNGLARCIGPSGDSYIGGTYFVPAVLAPEDEYYKIYVRFAREDTYYRIGGVFNPKILDRMDTSIIVGPWYLHDDLAYKISDDIVEFTARGETIPRRRAVYQSVSLKPLSVSQSDVYGFFCFITSYQESHPDRRMGTPHLHPNYDYPHVYPFHITEMVSHTGPGDDYYNPWGFPAFIHPTFVYDPEVQENVTRFTLDSDPTFAAPENIQVRAGVWLRKDVVVAGIGKAIYCMSPIRDEYGYYQSVSASNEVITLTDESTIDVSTYTYGGITPSRSSCLFLQKEFLYMGTLGDIVSYRSNLPPSLVYIPSATTLNLGGGKKCEEVPGEWIPW